MALFFSTVLKQKMEHERKIERIMSVKIWFFNNSQIFTKIAFSMEGFGINFGPKFFLYRWLFELIKSFKERIPL